jgi:hypothetical protein
MQISYALTVFISRDAPFAQERRCWISMTITSSREWLEFAKISVVWSAVAKFREREKVLLIYVAPALFFHRSQVRFLLNRKITQPVQVLLTPYVRLFQKKVNAGSGIGQRNSQGCSGGACGWNGLVVSTGSGGCGSPAVDLDAKVAPPGLKGALVSADVDAKTFGGAFAGGVDAEKSSGAEGEGDSIILV